MYTHATTEKTNASSFVNKKKQQPFFSPVIIQPKLTIGPVDDHYEREADAMADKVMRMTDHDVISLKPSPVIIQKKCAVCEAEEKLRHKEENVDEPILQKKSITDISLQRKCAHCEAEEKQDAVQLKPISNLFIQKCAACEAEEKNIHRKESISNVPDVTPSVHETLHSGGQSLDHGTLSFMESRFGYDFSNVQIHNDSLAHQLSSDINALAYTHGNHIVFGKNQYQPTTQSGKQLLAHELTHVVQQNGNLSPKLIQRQPAPSGRSTTVNSNGKQYEINRDYQTISNEREQYLPPAARLGADAKNVYIQVTWCKDERGSIKIGANIPQQAEDLLKRIATDAATNDGKNIRAELEKTDLTPFINLEVAKSGKWKFSVQTNITVDSSGIKSVGGSIVVDTGSIKITGSVSGSKDQGVTGTVGVEVPLGKGPEKFKCKTERIKAKYKPTDTCKLITPEHTEPGIKKETNVDEKSVYIYFEYAKKDIEPKKTKPEIDKLRGFIGSNYSVKKVIGYTSPEGLMPSVKGFIGNEELSKQRTKAAFDKTIETCDAVNKIHPEISCSGITSETEQTPGNELYTLTREVNGETKEVEGDELVESAEEQFLESPGEKRFTDDPDFRKKLEKAKTPKQKADLIYPLLRRAKIVLEKTTTTETPISTTVPEKKDDVDCNSIPGYADIKTNWDVNDNLDFGQ